MLKVTLGQINPTIGDIDGNIELMDRAAYLAFREGSNVIVFPELNQIYVVDGEASEVKIFQY